MAILSKPSLVNLVDRVNDLGVTDPPRGSLKKQRQIRFTDVDREAFQSGLSNVTPPVIENVDTAVEEMNATLLDQLSAARVPRQVPTPDGPQQNVDRWLVLLDNEDSKVYSTRHVKDWSNMYRSAVGTMNKAKSTSQHRGNAVIFTPVKCPHTKSPHIKRPHTKECATAHQAPAH